MYTQRERERERGRTPQKRSRRTIQTPTDNDVDEETMTTMATLKGGGLMMDSRRMRRRGMKESELSRVFLLKFVWGRMGILCGCWINAILVTTTYDRELSGMSNMFVIYIHTFEQSIISYLCIWRKYRHQQLMTFLISKWFWFGLTITCNVRCQFCFCNSSRLSLIYIYNRLFISIWRRNKNTHNNYNVSDLAATTISRA